MDEKAFNEKYWYPNTSVVTVRNPRKEDYVFQSTVETGVDPATGRMKTETRHYKVAAGAQERFPGPIANMYLDQMAKLVAQDEDKIQFMIDFTLRAQYYDKLTVHVEDLIRDYQPFPEYLDNPAEVKPQGAQDKAEEKPFGGLNQPEEAPKRMGRPPKVSSEA